MLLLVLTSGECLPSSFICNDPVSLLWSSVFIRLFGANSYSVDNQEFLSDTLPLSSNSDVTTLTEFSTSYMLSPMTQRGSWSLVLLDRVSDCFSLGVFFIQFCFAYWTRPCLNLLVRDHLIAVSVDVPFGVCWLSLNAFVPSIGLLTIASHQGTNISNSVPISQSILPIQSHFD